MEIDTEKSIIKMESNGYEIEVDLSKVEEAIEKNEKIVDADGEGLNDLQRRIKGSIYVTAEPTDEKWEELADKYMDS